MTRINRFSFLVSDAHRKDLECPFSFRLSHDLFLLLLSLGPSPFLVGPNCPLFVWPLVGLLAGSLQPAELTPEA
ncbi:jg4921 [Pararge aegeria aegeria]|uniref:Jg4921 protein n=1 Tax=Pararge aegeria aegeria TaxID=348720 RepID=A0A8S4SMA3_9NEOP|nr:jg4921 [Pararge aegeria aegeria]